MAAIIAPRSGLDSPEIQGNHGIHTHYQNLDVALKASVVYNPHRKQDVSGALAFCHPHRPSASLSAGNNSAEVTCQQQLLTSG